MSEMVQVTDQGFTPLAEAVSVSLEEFLAAQAPQGAVTLRLAPDDDIAPLATKLEGIAAILISFPSFSDGRGFTVARQLRRMGYRGALWAAGPVVADQYAMLRSVGFDGAHIPADIAQRQPWEQWLPRAKPGRLSYLSRLRA